MAWNGLGLFLRSFLWADDATNVIDISSSRMDSEFANYKGGLENCVTRDGQNQALGNLPMGTFRHTAVGAATLRDQYGRVAEIQDGGFIWGGTAGGTANALTVAVTPALIALTAGQAIRFVSGAAANSGAATLAVNGLAATAIVKEGGAALAAGDLPASTLIEVVYNGTNYRLGRPGVLLSGALLSDVVHTTGTESIGGLKTMTNVLSVQFTNAYMQIRDTASTLPAGLWALQGFNLGDFRLLRNTAAGGDFSTANSPLVITAADAATFLGTVSAATATAAAHLVRKDQLDAKVYGGQIANNGTASVTYGPSGWTVSRSGVGNTTVTHNLGTTSYSVVVLGQVDNLPTAILVNLSANTFQIKTRDNNILSDMNYNFVVARN